MSLEEFKAELAEAKINGPTNLISSKRVLLNTKACSCSNIHQHFNHDSLILKDLGGTGDCVFRVLQWSAPSLVAKFKGKKGAAARFYGAFK
jgi:hypothetical protein